MGAGEKMTKNKTQTQKQPKKTPKWFMDQETNSNNCVKWGSLYAWHMRNDKPWDVSVPHPSKGYLVCCLPLCKISCPESFPECWYQPNFFRKWQNFTKKNPNSGIASAYKNSVVRATSGLWNHSFSLPSEDWNLFFLEQFLCQRSDSVSPLSNITVMVN